jgi:hypothetical protein
LSVSVWCLPCRTKSVLSVSVGVVGVGRKIEPKRLRVGRCPRNEQALRRAPSASPVGGVCRASRGPQLDRPRSVARNRLQTAGSLHRTCVRYRRGDGEGDNCKFFVMGRGQAADASERRGNTAQRAEDTSVLTIALGVGPRTLSPRSFSPPSEGTALTPILCRRSLMTTQSEVGNVAPPSSAVPPTTRREALASRAEQPDRGGVALIANSQPVI